MPPKFPGTNQWNPSHEWSPEPQRLWLLPASLPSFTITPLIHCFSHSHSSGYTAWFWSSNVFPSRLPLLRVHLSIHCAVCQVWTVSSSHTSWSLRPTSFTLDPWPRTLLLLSMSLTEFVFVSFSLVPFPPFTRIWGPHRPESSVLFTVTPHHTIVSLERTEWKNKWTENNSLLYQTLDPSLIRFYLSPSFETLFPQRPPPTHLASIPSSVWGAPSLTRLLMVHHPLCGIWLTWPDFNMNPARPLAESPRLDYKFSASQYGWVWA